MNTIELYEGRMTAHEIYDLLNKAGIEYELMHIFQGSRILKIVVEEEDETEET